MPRLWALPLDRIKRWVEKTPANRDHIAAILSRFPQAKILVTMRDPRAILAAQIAITEKRARKDFSIYYVIAHWRVAAKLAERIWRGDGRDWSCHTNSSQPIHRVR